MGIGGEERLGVKVLRFKLNGERENKVSEVEKSFEGDRVLSWSINIREVCVKIRGIYRYGFYVKGKLIW